MQSIGKTAICGMIVMAICAAEAQKINTRPPNAPAVSKPRLTSVSPSHGEQGSRVLLTISGNDIPNDASLLFTPSSGIRVLRSKVQSPAEIVAQIEIDSFAQPGLRQVGIHSQSGKASVPSPFRVLAASPVLLKITPNQVAAGSKGVELKIEGRNFTPGAQVTFGGRHQIFTPSPVTFVNATEIHVTIDVLPIALSGGHDVTVRNPTNATGTGKGMLNILPADDAPKK